VFLTLTSPVTILFYLAVFAGAQLPAGSAGAAAAVSLIIGIFLGSLCWAIGVSLALSRLRAALPYEWLKGMSVAAGLLILGFGLWAIGNAIIR
jgi:threonine/homoserine/homoserine lactone efflux protein